VTGVLEEYDRFTRGIEGDRDVRCVVVDLCGSVGVDERLLEQSQLELGPQHAGNRGVDH